MYFGDQAKVPLDFNSFSDAVQYIVLDNEYPVFASLITLQ